MDGRDTMHVWSGPIERFDCAEAGSHEHSPSPAPILTIITPNVLLFYRCNPVVLASRFHFKRVSRRRVIILPPFEMSFQGVQANE